MDKVNCMTRPANNGGKIQSDDNRNDRNNPGSWSINALVAKARNELTPVGTLLILFLLVIACSSISFSVYSYAEKHNGLLSDGFKSAVLVSACVSTLVGVGLLWETWKARRNRLELAAG